ncbi:MAG TPA: UDP-N-acetylmuramate--L-alanine ligase [Dehalococcoidia bacterium]|nr:UDP-N-acetylmuramate--L-alanine ligase [Dehalococcoidia bacterium]
MTHVAERTIPQRVHLIGVGGIHMSGIAQILRDRGHTVSGSDIYLTPLTRKLEKMGVTVHEGHAGGNIDDAELVVYTSAAHADNPELLEAQRRGIEAIKRAEMVAVLQQGKQVIAVAGAHGKTTTSSLIAFMLHKAGLSPTIMLGGEARDLGSNALPGEGPHFVVEADEYDRAFLNYHSHIAVVTNVEPDHLDIYGSFEELQRAYAQFLAQVDISGFIVACLDSPPLQACLSQRQAFLPRTVGGDVTYPVHVTSYSHLSPEADWYAEIVSPQDEASKGIDGSTFVVRFQKQLWGEFVTRLPGAHNVSNSLAAIAVGEIVGVPKDTVREAIAEFKGAARRFEFVGEAAAVIVMDDYAHHPTEIRASLAAARTRFPGRRIVVLFQPHTYTRTAYLLDEFRDCFADCDALFIADTYAAREDPSEGMDAKALTGEITTPKAVCAGPVSEAAALVADELREGDVFFTVGAGDVDKAGPLVLKALEAR